MERNPQQAIIGQFSLWVRDISPNRSYWLLILTNYGIYDGENSHITKLLSKYESRPTMSPLAGLQAAISGNSKSKLDVTLDFFLWLYSEDEALCFQIMQDIYNDFVDDEDIPEPYEHVDKLEEISPGESHPEIKEDEIVPMSYQVVGEGDEFGFYRYIAQDVEEVEDEVFIVDPYIDKEAIRLYLADTTEDVEKRILTQEPQGNFDDVAEKLTSETNHQIAVRTTAKCHDRLMFLDDRCYLVGISIKDAGRNPNYVVDFESVDRFRRPWEEMWDDASEYKIFGAG